MWKFKKREEPVELIEIDCPIFAPYNRMGMGSHIGLLSLLLSTNKQCKINVSDIFSTPGGVQHPLIELKRVFNIWDDRILIGYKNDWELDSDLILSSEDNAKFYSNYPRPESIYCNSQWLTAFANQSNFKRKGHVCIAIGGNIDNARSILLNEKVETRHPKISGITSTTIHEIQRIVIESGRDILTVEDNSISIDKKVFLLNEFCDCVIGYEGGLMHLAHCLGIPTIILPWANEHVNPSSPSDLFNKLLPEHKFTAPMKFHIDKRSYFPSSVDEITRWSGEDLNDMLLMLYSDKGNNILLDVEFNQKLSKFDLNTQYDLMNIPKVVREILRSSEKAPTLGGLNIR